MRSCRSTMSRSAEPLPCAIQVPEQARITGSSAVTRPLAGRCTSDAVAAVAYVDVGLAVGDDDDVVAVQLAAQHGAQGLLRPRCAGCSSRGRYWRSSSRISARTSRAIGRSSGHGDPLDGRSRPSPRSSARMPCTQPRQRELRDDHGDQRDARRRARRRSRTGSAGSPRCAAATKLMSCTSTSCGRAASGIDAAHRDMQRPRGTAARARRRRRRSQRVAARAAREKSAWRSASATPGRGTGRPRACRSSCAIRLNSVGIRGGRARLAIRSASGRDRVGDQVRADVEVAHEPAQHQGVGERHRGVREDGQREQQRNQKAK